MRICMIAFGPIEERTGGYEVRCNYLIESLTDLGHDVYVLEFPATMAERRKDGFVTQSGKVKFVHLRGNEHADSVFLRALSSHLGKSITIYPILFIRTQLYSIAELLKSREIIKHCNVVFVESVFFPFGIVLGRFIKKKVVLDTHYVGKLQAQKYRKNSLNFWRLLTWDILERFASALSDLVIAVSEEEKSFLKKEYGVPEHKLLVVPVTVEIPRAKASTQQLRENIEKWKLQDKIVIAFLGTLEAAPNRDAAKYILCELAPYVYERRKDVVFLIVGKGKEQFESSTLPNVVFTGFVKDVSPLLELSDLCIAPLRFGSGVKTKVLEYMSHGKVVLTTPEGTQGITLGKGDSVIVSDMKDYRAKLIELIDNIVVIREKGRINEEIIREHYSPSILRKRILKVLE